MLWLDVLFNSCVETTQEDHGWGSADENWPTETAGNGGGCLAFIDSDRGAETRLNRRIPVSTAGSSRRACLPGVGSWRVREGVQIQLGMYGGHPEEAPELFRREGSSKTQDMRIRLTT